MGKVMTRGPAAVRTSGAIDVYGLVQPLVRRPTEGHSSNKSEASGKTTHAANNQQEHYEDGNRTPDLQPKRREIEDVAVVLQMLR
jgi:hypothetical protein